MKNNRCNDQLPGPKQTKFGFKYLWCHTPNKMRHLGTGIAVFCASFSLTLLANDYKLPGIILGGLGLFVDKVIIPFFGEENVSN